VGIFGLTVAAVMFSFVAIFGEFSNTKDLLTSDNKLQSLDRFLHPG
jgi:hypothetical protein